MKYGERRVLLKTKTYSSSQEGHVFEKSAMVRIYYRSHFL